MKRHNVIAVAALVIVALYFLVLVGRSGESLWSAIHQSDMKSRVSRESTQQTSVVLLWTWDKDHKAWMNHLFHFIEYVVLGGNRIDSDYDHP